MAASKKRSADSAVQTKASLAIEVLPIGTIIPYARNPRRNEHAVAKVAGSIKEFGFRQPIVVDKEMVIIVGHTRLLAAQQLGFTHVPVHIAENLSPSQIKAYRIADNRTNEEAEWDEEMLAIELGDLRDADFDLDLTGFDPDELEELLAGEGTEGLTDDDEVPDLQAEAISKHGDVWLCGNHRLLCGDSTVATDVEKAMGGSLADMVFTDPPYNVNYASPNAALSAKKNIKNDNLGDGFYQFLYDAMVNLLTFTKGAIYISMSSSELHTLQKAFKDAGGHWSTFIMWAKNTFSLGRSDYQRQYEPILYGWKEGNKHFWCGARDQGDVWFFNKPRTNDLHPTMKPVELVQRAIENSSKTRDIILDLFGGSGTTMIAAEKTNRTAVLLELDPLYCDVIVRRWQAFTGRKATLESTGEPFPTTENSND